MAVKSNTSTSSTSAKKTTAKTQGTRSSGSKKTSAKRGAARSNGAGVTSNGALPTEDQLEKLLAGLKAVRDGDFSVSISGRRGTLMGEIASAFNDVVQMNARNLEEIQRAARVIGQEGKMTSRLAMGRATGGWATRIETINGLIDDLVRPTSEVARVIEAVAKGDLTQKMALKIDNQSVKGEFLRIGTTVNSMVDQLSSFAEEVTRVAREVGTEGKLGGQAKVKGVSGTWKDLTENVNLLAGNLTNQVRDIAQVTTAVARGDLTQKITVDVKGEVLELKNTVNTMVDQLSSFADEVTRVAREVGTEGRLGGQAKVKGVSGTWKDLTENVNLLAGNLTSQVRNIAQVTTAVARGDLDQKVTVGAKGEVAALADTINSMTDTLRAFANEVTRVAREVGTEGRLGGQAQVEGVSGTWKDLTDNVNFMASNLTSQVRNIAQVTTAVARGDLDQKVTVGAKGEVAALADTINSMTDTLRDFANEVTRVAREVGTEGRLGGQAQVEGVAGTWKDLTESVNGMASSLTAQVRDIAQVTTAVANGELSQKITVEVKGEMLELKNTINTMVDQLSSFADEVTRVAREVGTEGKLGGQAEVKGVSGTWKDLTENVNFMASNLTSQVRNIAQVTTAVARGDLSQKISVEAKGEVAALAETINSMTYTLRAFADEVTRVAREVGTEGKLGGQARVEGVSGTWKDLTDSVNQMASNLTAQVRDIVQVTTAVANGELSQKITVDVRGEILELKKTINTMVDQLSSFADEVTRVAREVGTEGRLGGQAKVEGVSGTWRDLTENVNQLASNLTSQVRNIAQVTTAVARGDLSQKISVEAKGEVAALAETINTMVDQLSSFADEVTRVAREVGTEGKLGGQARVEGVSGTWKHLTENVNFMASNLTDQVRDIAQVTTAVARGDLSQKISVEAKGEVAALAETINTMVDQLSSFADEVTRVASEVGTEGKLGGQAQVEGVSGTWRALTENVNSMASNLTDQVRNIAQVATAVAEGDLSQKITVDAKGEILRLKDTINTMVDQLSAFAAEVTRVAREVGTEGKLGGQAQVEGVSGTWRGLTENVNQLAGNLTTQVRAIADVATAVTQGDLTRSITVAAEGEVAQLKDKINQMIGNLKETTQRNEEQDWLKTNLAKVSGMMQGQRDLLTVSSLIMSELSPTVNAQHGAFFLAESDNGDEPELRLKASYGYKKRKSVSNKFALGEGLVGQAALERKPIIVTEAPTDYIKVTSGLGEASPVNITVLPIVFEDQVLGVIELASLRPFSEVNLTFLEQLVETIGVVLNTIIANMTTEELLGQSQRLTQELQSQSEELQTQQEELQQTNEELQEKAALLADQNRNIEIKNHEIETARAGLEEKAQQLALSSKYKSEFLANMSHELRTPLNSLLILAKLLMDNPENNLTEKQVDFARTILNAGSDLLSLINDILDLSKVEAGKMDVNLSDVVLAETATYAQQAFGPLADEKSLQFRAVVSSDAPAHIHTDEQRLQQILNNLLSNAFKFTHEGEVTLSIGLAPKDVRFVSDHLNKADRVVAFSVRDTGVGVPQDKLRLIFEAFQQADGTTSRRYGGTGLGLSISREIARLLGGEIHVASELGAGSTFTFYVSDTFAGERPVDHDPSSSESGSDGAVGFEGPLALAAGEEPSTSMPDIPDDRHTIEAGDRVLMIVDPDADFAATALEAARTHGFKGLIAIRREVVVPLTREHRPNAVLLDGRELNDGLDVLRRLKADSSTRHIPVHYIADKDLRREALTMGAASYLGPPVTPEALDAKLEEIRTSLDQKTKNLLVVEDNEVERMSIIELIGSESDVVITAVGSSEEALQALKTIDVDCMVLDLKLPDMSGFDLLAKLKKDKRYLHLPIIIYTGRELTRKEDARLRKYADTIIVKDVRSPERLLAETALYLHRDEATLPATKRKMIEQVHDAEVVFQGKKVLIVDDDVRNVFALTSVLEGRGLEVLYAENGKDGITTLKENPDVSLVLMDIMMPEMDGYETTQALRKIPEFAGLPVIALTAKAMSGDREKSIAAGVSDYITKPVDIDQLISLMQVWLYE